MKFIHKHIFSTINEDEVLMKYQASSPIKEVFTRNEKYFLRDRSTVRYASRANSDDSSEESEGNDGMYQKNYIISNLHTLILILNICYNVNCCINVFQILMTDHYHHQHHLLKMILIHRFRICRKEGNFVTSKKQLYNHSVTGLETEL